MEQEAADELVGGERHDLLAVGTAAAIVLVAERDAGLVEAQEAAVRDGDAVGVARQVGEHRLGPGEGELGIDHPVLLPDRGQVPQEGAAVDEMREAAEEAEQPGLMQCHQPGQEQAAEQLAQHPDRQQERGARCHPAAPVRRQPATRHDHVDVRVVGHRRAPYVDDPLLQGFGHLI